MILVNYLANYFIILYDAVKSDENDTALYSL